MSLDRTDTVRVDHPSGSLAAAIVGVGVVAGALSAEVDPIPEVGFVLQMMGVGTAIGLIFTFFSLLRDRAADARLIATGWALAGLGLGLLVVLLDAVAF